MRPSPPRILIIEPHPILREGMVAVISSAIAGADVTGSPDFSDALECVRNQNTDLVITDFRIQGDSVLPFLTGLRAVDLRAKCLILSALDEMQAGYHAIRAGASGFIHRSAPVTGILDAIRLILAGQSYCSERLSRALISQQGPAPLSSAGSRLTPRELQIFSLIGECLTVSQIATRLGLAEKTVESHRENVKNKLGHQNAAQVTAAAVRWNAGISA